MPEITLAPPTLVDTPCNAMPEMKIPAQGWYDALAELCKKNNHVYVIDPDFLDSLLDNELKEKCKTRVFDRYIENQNIFATAAGLSFSGNICYIKPQEINAVCSAWDQIRNTIIPHKLNMKIGGIKRSPTNENKMTSEAIDLGLMQLLPELTIIYPCDYYQTKKAVSAISNINGPCYIRLNTMEVPVLTNEFTPFEVGKATLIKDGHDVSIIAIGLSLFDAIEASRKLESEGIHALVLHIHTIQPPDKEMIIACAKKTQGIVVVEENTHIIGLGNKIAKIVAEENPMPIKCVDVQEAKHGKTSFGQLSDSIVDRAKNILENT